MRTHKGPIKIVCECGLGRQAVIWRADEPLDTAVGRGVRQLYRGERGATIAGDWRITRSSTDALEIESVVKDARWERAGVIRVRLDRASGAATRWLGRVAG